MHKVSPPVKAVRCCTGHEPLGSVVVRLFGNAGAQLGKDFLFGFRTGVKLAQALVGLTDIVESGVGKACGGAGRVKSTDEYRIEFAID